MPTKPACKSSSARILACLLSVTLVVSLCPLQGWSEEPTFEPELDQLTEVVPLTDEPETPQLTKAVPLGAEPEPSETPKKADTPEIAKVIFVLASEPTATWPNPENVVAPEGEDPATADIIIDIPVGDKLGSFVPPTPISSDDSLVFEGWQTEDFETIDENDLRGRTIEGDAILYATFSLKPAGNEQRAEPAGQIAKGVWGTCQWDIWGTSTSGTLTINAGTLGSYYPNWRDYKDRITNVVINPGVAMGVDTNSLFYGCSNLVSITGLSNLKTDNATLMTTMFDGCSKLTSLDLSSWNTSNVTNMNNMFKGCSSLTSLNISSWNTSNVQYMGSMFENCSSLTSLDLSSLDTSRVTEMYSMFEGCLSLTSLNISSWNTSNVANMRYMFQGCSKLTSLDLSSWNTSNVTNMDYMFRMCSRLSSLSISSWNMSNVTNMNYMFYGCNYLHVIPSSFTFGATTEANRENIFNVTSGATVITTYNGSKEDVKNYDWPAATRALYGTPLTGSVTVSGDAGSVGQTLTASAKFENVCRNAQQRFTWYRGTSATDANPERVLTGTTYTTSNGDVGKYIICKMTDSLGAYTGSVSATGIGPVIAPFSASVTVSGTAVVGQPLTASVLDANASYSYKWQRADSVKSTWFDIANAASGTYRLTQDDFGKIVRCVLVPSAAGYVGDIASNATAAVKGVLTGTVRFSGTAKVGSALTAIVDNPSSGVVPFTYKWYRSSTASGGSLVATTSTNSYPLQDADKGMYISCEVSVTDTAAWTGSARSGWSARVLKDFSATVTLSGDERTDSILTAKVTDSNASGEVLSYQWYRSSSPSGDGTLISGATSATYRQTDADRNKYLSCVVSVANADANAWTGSVRSNWKGPSLTTFAASVRVSGSAVVGQTLTAKVESSNASSYSYKWQRAPKGTALWTGILNATGSTYELGPGDFGQTIRCLVKATPAGYTGEVVSNVTDPVKGKLTGTVSLEGTAKVGSTFTANVNNPSSGQVVFAYKWYRSSTGTDTGELISGATSNSYELKDADKGMFVSCEVSVADTAAWTGSIRSGWSARVLKDFSGTVSIDGSMLTGSKLTAKVSGNAGSETLSYRWYRSDSNSGDGTLISDATSSTYQQTDADRNKYLSCVVSVANADANAWTGSVRSGWKGPSLTTFAAGVRLSGTTVVGQPLKANVSDPNASSYSYKWQRADRGSANWTDIPSATADTYSLVQDDFGKIVRCVVTATTAGYTGEVASDATATIQGALDGKVSVSGNLYANQKLTASVQNLSFGATAAYRWYIATNAAGTDRTLINGATASELDLSPLRTQVVGKYIVCEVYDSSNAYVNTVSSSAVGPVGIAWGTSGPKAGGCIWTIDAAGVMTISPAANGQGSLGELKASSAPWDDFVSQVKSASIASDVKSGASLAGMFSSCRQMTEVDLSGLDATDATDLSSMFYGCSSLATVNGLAALNAAKPANLGSMFYGCSKLTTLDLSGLAAGTATDLSAMFRDCSQLSDLKLPAGFVGEKCSTAVNMFYGCNALTTIPATFSFGSNKSIQTAGCFTVTASDPLATTYLGDDLNVTTYDWKGSNRSLVVWKLSGEATITEGDDPIADNELTASATFTGPAAGLEEGATYQWCTANSTDDTNPVAIDKAKSAAYSPRKADVGKYLVCLVSAPSGSGAQGTLRVATTKAVRAPQVWATVPSRTQVYVDSQGRASVPTTSAYALGALDSEGKATEGDIQLVGVTLTLSDSTYPGGSWTLGTPGDDKIKASTFIENKAFATPGTACTVADAPAIAPGSKLPLEWEASFKNDIGPKLTSLLTAADGEGARYGGVEFKVAWKPRA